MDYQQMVQLFTQMGYPPAQAANMARRASTNGVSPVPNVADAAPGDPSRGSLWNDAQEGWKMLQADPGGWLRMMTNPNAPAPIGAGYPAVRIQNPAGDPSPSAMPAWLVAQQEQRRYGGSPMAGDGLYRSPATVQPHPTAANPSNYRPPNATGWKFAQPKAAAGSWQQGMWDAMLAGQNPLSSVPAANWPEALDLLQNYLPLMQQQNYQSRDRVAADYQNRQLAEQVRQADLSQGNWTQQFTAGRQDQGFQNWLAMQQLAQGAGGQSFNQDLQNRQLAEQIRQADQGQGNWTQQFQAGRDDALWGRGFQQQQFGEQQRQFDVGQGNWTQQFAAGRDDALWGRDFSNRQLGEQVRQFDVGQGNWQQQFAAGRDDAQWNRGFNERQFTAGRDDALWNRGFNERQFTAGRDDALWGRGFQQQQADRSQSNWGAEMERNKALDAWSQAFQGAQFDWNKKQTDVQNKQNEESMYLSAFGRKFGPNVSSM